MEYITLSFYKYFHCDNPKALREDLFSVWGKLGILGRIYVAKEGINAQLTVPKENFVEFDKYMKSKDTFSDIPFKVAVEEGSFPSFKKLNIKIRNKIVADGLDDNTFDVTNTGKYLTASEINDYVNDREAIIVDMRNSYESEIGHFQGALRPDVDTFREELQVIPEMLKGKENSKIALYCTGGIRCEKASAWLKHRGFSDVKHLKGGIIDYKHQINNEGLPNKFLGKNFVFDERLGEKIGDEIISYCHLCSKEKSDTHYHCKNQVCHVLFIGCEDCLKKRKGYCSLWCIYFDKLPSQYKKLYARYYNKFFRPAQFKKNRLRLKSKEEREHTSFKSST